MLQLCGCYSASPCPLDTGLVRLIVYLAFRATPNALGPRRFTSFLQDFFEEGGFRLQDQSGFGLLDLLDRTEETGHFCVTFWILFFRSWSF